LKKRKCKICGAEAKFFFRSHRIALCENCVKVFVERRVERTIKSFQLMKRGEKVLIAVSGGKDSLALWQILENLGYQADGLFIDLGIPNFSAISMEKSKLLAEKLPRKLFIVKIEDFFNMNLIELARKERREPCAFCGMIKRYIMNKTALEYGYDVIATGHHLDDECSVLLGNVLNWQIEYLKRQGPILHEREGFVRKVKPLALCSEEEISSYAKAAKINYIEERCPLSKGATSHFYKSIINQIEEKMPGAKLRFYKEFLKNKKRLFGEEVPPQLKPCERCGYPTTAGICTFCRLREKIKNKGGV